MVSDLNLKQFTSNIKKEEKERRGKKVEEVNSEQQQQQPPAKNHALYHCSKIKELPHLFPLPSSVAFSGQNNTLK